MYLPSITAKDISITQEVIDIFRKRAELIKELSYLDSRLESIKEEQVAAGIIKGRKPMPAPTPEQVNTSFRTISKTLTREFPCHCGAIFPSFLERETHIDLKTRSICGRNGELQNGKHIHRDTDTVGDPVKSSTNLRKSTPLFIDDDLEIA
jgi:hypothetical protein